MIFYKVKKIKMNKKLVALFTLSASLFFPIVVLGLNFPDLINGQPGQAWVVPNVIDNIFGFIWMFFVAFAILMFLVAGFLFLSANGDPAKIKSARNAVLWGSVGMIVGILSFSVPFIIQLILGL